MPAPLSVKRAKEWMEELEKVSAQIGWEADQGNDDQRLANLKARQLACRERLMYQLTGVRTNG